MGSLDITIPACSGDIWIISDTVKEIKPLKPVEFAPPLPSGNKNTKNADAPTDTKTKEPTPVVVPQNKAYEDMTIEELQSAILDKMAKNGPVTDQMKKTVYDNTHHGSLINWVKSFN